MFAWISMSLSGYSARLQPSGFRNVKYFTVLSNLFEALACILFAVSVPLAKLRVFAETVKFAAAMCLMVTFSVVLLFLGPVFGFQGMYSNMLLFMHLVIPLISFAEYLFFCRPHPHFLVTLLPVSAVVLYGSCYLINVIVNWTGEIPNPNDFYGFASWGIVPGALLFILLCAATWGMSVLCRLLNRFLSAKIK